MMADENTVRSQVQVALYGVHTLLCRKGEGLCRVLGRKVGCAPVGNGHRRTRAVYRRHRRYA